MQCQHQCNCTQGLCDSGKTGSGACLCKTDGKDCSDHKGKCDAATGLCTCTEEGTYGPYCEKTTVLAATMSGLVASVCVVGAVTVATRLVFHDIKERQKKLQNFVRQPGLGTPLMNGPNSWFLLTHFYRYFEVAGLAVLGSRPHAWGTGGSSIFSALKILFIEVSAEFWTPAYYVAVAIQLVFSVVTYSVYLHNRDRRPPHQRVDNTKSVNTRAAASNGQTGAPRGPLPCNTVFLCWVPYLVQVVSAIWVTLLGYTFGALDCNYHSAGQAPFMTHKPQVQCWSTRHVLEFVFPSVVGMVQRCAVAGSV